MPGVDRARFIAGCHQQCAIRSQRIGAAPGAGGDRAFPVKRPAIGIGAIAADGDDAGLRLILAVLMTEGDDGISTCKSLLVMAMPGAP